MLGRLFGKSEKRSIPGDHFGLGDLCEKHGLAQKARKIVAYSRPAVEIRLAEFNCGLAHTASRIGGYPALPENAPWPLNKNLDPMMFLAQFSCGELAAERFEGLPDEGLLSIFLDTMDEQPLEAKVFYHSLTKDLTRRPAPHSPAKEKMAYRPTFHAIITVPRPDNSCFAALRLSVEEKRCYNELLHELDERLDSSALQLGGHPPYRLEEEAIPEDDDGNWEFFLAVHDIEELFVSWPEGGCAFVWIPPLDTRFQDGKASVTWQLLENDEWEDEEWEDEEGDDE